ncbi:hypothetical protein BCR33DRAFT_720523 [Rhizoclosmatium globosum]|uniref:Cullin N-terminal domain-containing protein n=1 Tax=Rhizoclosmatium globosum TaxID=329046 RepID=A0A1Y2BVS2_9FUNG|nr:hypothetical protein BCR33DRAFT_720523 [Rhizoclosmatium globosum]|eukprot:ORY38860.1 hypothetical protein BCR33DRAFT_720523 [Rhizoclosmatium globosum]
MNTSTDYAATWSDLERFLSCAIDPDLHAAVPLSNFSHETLYRHVYRLCLRPQHRRRLALDFSSAIAALLEVQRTSLGAASDESWLACFAARIHHAVWAAAIVRDVFVYFVSECVGRACVCS